MSQIGYMIMGVSVGAYAAGLFHLMTHAFFKALLFMAAGSIIGAMGGEQSLRGWAASAGRCRFTFACFSSAASRCRASRRFSGFFSKDEILLVTAERGGWHWALYVLGYFGALLTAIYTFRHDLPRLPRRARARRRASSKPATCTTRRCPPTRRTAKRRTPTSASPARTTRSPSAPCRCGGDDRARGRRGRSPASSRSRKWTT